MGQAATAAVALTVVGAMAAVLITRPPTSPGTSAEPSGAGESAGPSAAAFTPLPRRALYGDLPQPSTILMQAEGDFSLVDLERGATGGALTGAAYGSAIQERADGTLLCLCVKLSGSVNGQATHAEVTLDRFDGSGKLLSTAQIASLSGEPDPRDPEGIPERPAHLGFDASFSAGGRYGFIGWSERAHPVWRSGVIVVDLAQGREVSRLDLPDASTGEGETRRVVFGPRVVGQAAAGEGALAISREWYSWSPPASQGENYRQETEVFRADFAAGAGTFSNPTPVDVSACGERVLRAASTARDRWWMACTRFSTSAVVVRRFDATGARLGDTSAAGGFGVDGDLTAPSPDGNSLFVWNPTGALLTRIDLASGEKTEGGAATARVEAGPLAALGQWLAPAAAAKTFLSGAVVVSRDGSRVYAAGIDTEAATDGTSGSTGIFVFDAASLEHLARWDPTADFISLAASRDGRYLYAAGLPRVDAAGTPRPAVQASVTVFDTADGSVRLVAGELGGELLTFPGPTLD